MKNPKHLLTQFSMFLLLIFLFTACEKKEDDIDTTPPMPVTELTAVPSEGQVVLSWTEPTCPDLDRIEISYTPGTGVILSQLAGLNSITLTGLTNGSSYEFEVRTVDETGNKSDAVTVTAVPNTPFVVVSPDQSDYFPAGGSTYSSDGSGHLIISVTFNRAVDLNSVVPAATIYFEGDAVSQGTVSFSNGNKTVTFTTTDELADFAIFSGNIIFDFFMIGDDAGNGIIMDSNGMVLDGDEDGVAGGDYELNLYIIG
jgi:hypothetical protein